MFRVFASNGAAVFASCSKRRKRQSENGPNFATKDSGWSWCATMIGEAELAAIVQTDAGSAGSWI
jgi:hypothetical protein